MKYGLKFMNLNVEGSKHFDRIYPFIAERDPDVVCCQEFPESEVLKCAEYFDMEYFFVPMTKKTDEATPQGLVIFSQFPILQKRASQYGGAGIEEIPVFDKRTYEIRHKSVKFLLAICDIEKNGEMFRIGTTHFPVTEKGFVTDYQRTDMRRLLEILKKEEPLVFSGDFNAPRGGEIFLLLADRYTDTVPTEYKTSLDLELHRAAIERKHEITDKMVDGIFSTPEYMVSNFEMVCGVSDHCAFVANISQR